MALHEIKQISIKHFLTDLGITPAKDSTRYGMYNSPFREDHTASLKVDYPENLWIDYGTNEGGTLIDLVMKMEHCSLHAAITMLEQKYSHTDVGTYQSYNRPTDQQVTFLFTKGDRVWI